jgi:hypothetical protein
MAPNPSRSALALLAPLALADPVAAEPSPAPAAVAALVVTVANEAAVDADVLAAARRQVADVFAKIGVRVVWGTEAAAIESGNGSDRVPGRSVLCVPLVSQDGQSRASARLAVRANVLGRACRVLRRATIYVHRTKALAARHRLSPSKVLAYAIAHELGHIVLPAGHSADGLMRASYDVRSGRVESFTADQGEMIRAKVVEIRSQ